MKSPLQVVSILFGLQVLLVGGYLLVEASKERTAAIELERLDRPSPELTYRTFDAGQHRLSEHHGTPVLVHFWATWCPPCREELPALLEFAASSEVRVLAISVDPQWYDVREFLRRDPPPEVVLATAPSAAGEFGVVTLPETFLVDSTGHLRLRLPGARDWTSPALRELVLDESE